MDSQLQEVIGNKLELVGPLVDSFLREIGKSIFSNLSRSKATGLASPIRMFLPWPVFRHVLTLVLGSRKERRSKLTEKQKHLITRRILTLRTEEANFSSARIMEQTGIENS